MKEIELTDQLFKGAVSLERTDEGVMPWRLNHKELIFFPVNRLLAKAKSGAGVRLRFETDAKELELVMEGTNVNRIFDLTVGTEIEQTLIVAADQSLLKIHLKGQLKIYELWFPLPEGQGLRLKSLKVNEGAQFSIPEETCPKWITYGSSISQCATAHSPARSWPAIVARNRKLDLTCLGYGANCHFEGMVAKMIRDLPADVITIKLGINVYGNNSLGPRSFSSAIINFIHTLREKHTDIPLGVISPIISPDREENLNNVGYNLKMMREEIKDVVSRFQEYGDKHIYYFDGLEQFGENDVEYLPDNLHPNGAGYELMGERISKNILPKLGY